ncbi:tRNA (adenosine(37)-N6)-dimethylallyltransferase MiaA [bacterium]|nr:tRNA (adenosine(37)-N6)-dimethylallyltransferase MiaA [bacterium]
MNNKLIIILGPTATGKTNLATKLAFNSNAEIISSDSRQVYKYLNIGTGKDLEEYNVNNKKINYHLIDIINIERNYSVYNFQKDFEQSYKSIIDKNKQAIVCGGTGLYIESLLLEYDLSNSPPPDFELRKELNHKSIEKLKEYFKEINKDIIKNPKLDTKNRIIRNIEICLNQKIKRKKNTILPIKNYTVIGINPGREQVRKKITSRLKYRLENGLVEEVENLLLKGISHERLNYFGLEYRFISKYLQKIYTKDEFFSKLNSAIHQFSKKQMTFFRRMEKRGIKINWINDNNINLIDKNLIKF